MAEHDFNVTEAFKRDCSECVIMLKQFCIEHKIPMYLAIPMKNSKNETDYLVVKQLPAECNCELYNDIFRKIVLNQNGFDLMLQNSFDLTLNNADTFDFDWLTRNERIGKDVVKPKENKKKSDGKKESQPVEKTDDDDELY